jgi:hypothetical protein
MSTDNLKIRVEHNFQGWLVVGGGLPRGSAWGIYETEGEARAEAAALADDLSLEVAA